MQRESFEEVLNLPLLYILLLAVYVANILISGFYPAPVLRLSAVIPLIQVTINPAGDRRFLLKVISVFQIAITIYLLASLIGINTQTRYLKNMSPEYNPENIVVVHNLHPRIIKYYPALRDQLLNIPSVEQVAASGHYIVMGCSGLGVRKFNEFPSQSNTISEYRIHPGLCKLYEFNLVNGRFFDPDRITDQSGALLNEAAVDMLGSTPEEIVGHQWSYGKIPWRYSVCSWISIMNLQPGKLSP